MKELTSIIIQPKRLRLILILSASGIIGIFLLVVSFYPGSYVSSESQIVTHANQTQYAIQCLNFEYSKDRIGSMTVRFFDNSEKPSFQIFRDAIANPDQVKLVVLDESGTGSMNTNLYPTDPIMLQPLPNSSTADFVLRFQNFYSLPRPGDSTISPPWERGRNAKYDEPILYFDGFPPIQIKKSQKTLIPFMSYLTSYIFFPVGLLLIAISSVGLILAFVYPETESKEHIDDLSTELGVPVSTIQTPKQKLEDIYEKVNLADQIKKVASQETPREKKEREKIEIEEKIKKREAELINLKNNKNLSEENRRFQENIIEDQLRDLNEERLKKL